MQILIQGVSDVTMGTFLRFALFEEDHEACSSIKSVYLFFRPDVTWSWRSISRIFFDDDKLLATFTVLPRSHWHGIGSRILISALSLSRSILRPRSLSLNLIYLRPPLWRTLRVAFFSIVVRWVLTSSSGILLTFMNTYCTIHDINKAWKCVIVLLQSIINGWFQHILMVHMAIWAS